METVTITRALTASLANFARKAIVIVMIALAAGLASSALLAGCEKKGPAEKAGENIDKAAKDVGDAVKDAGEQIKDAGKK